MKKDNQVTIIFKADAEKIKESVIEGTVRDLMAGMSSVLQHISTISEIPTLELIDEMKRVQMLFEATEEIVEISEINLEDLFDTLFNKTKE